MTEGVMKQYTFLLRLRIKGSQKIFREELGPGVIASQEVSFCADDAIWAAVTLMREEDRFVQEIIEVQTEEVKQCE